MSAPKKMADPFITCEGLVKIYKVAGLEVVALQGLDLTVKQGELVGVVGTSGSGKTTLLNILGGLDRPSAGRVLIGGRDLLQISETELDAFRRERVGFVWQQTTRNLLPYLTALENVEWPMMLLGCVPHIRHERAQALLKSLGLGNRLHYRPGRLSGGEQQRVAIAVALANQPSLLLADEPTGEVDHAMAKSIYMAFQQVTQLYGTTTVIVSHDPEIGQYVDRVVAFQDGKISTEIIHSSLKSIPIISEDIEAGLVSSQIPEKWIVLDKAGRLHIPRDYLIKLNASDRVKLEWTEMGLLIKPITGLSESLRADELSPYEGILYNKDALPQPKNQSLLQYIWELIDQVRIWFSEQRAKRT